MRYVGSIEIEVGKPQKIYINNEDDEITFVRENGEAFDKEELEGWAVLLNSPWSYINDKFTIQANIGKDFQLVKGEPEYICTREVVGYDGMTATCVGYGRLPDNALAECILLWDSIQIRFNPQKLAV